ncbi:hypothetical protein RB195_006732 [Necator americanus]|uniref:Uncharacterized protein n=1 Tax=Necator americanus TaxID=51031 RepID=A0ABR1BXA2_NECAM
MSYTIDNIPPLTLGFGKQPVEALPIENEPYWFGGSTVLFALVLLGMSLSDTPTLAQTSKCCTWLGQHGKEATAEKIGVPIRHAAMKPWDPSHPITTVLGAGHQHMGPSHTVLSHSFRRHTN